MIREFKAAGTVLWGKAMAAQLVVEMEQQHVKRPVIITEKHNLRKAEKAGKLLTAGYYHSIDLLLVDENHDSYDFLILAGGRSLTDLFRDDPRQKAHFPLSADQINEVSGPHSQFLVVDRALVGGRKPAPGFFRKYAESLTGGLIIDSGMEEIPSSFTYHNKTAVSLGDSSLEKLPRLLSERGIRKPLLLTDRGIVSVGLLDFVTAQLEGRPYALFSEIPPDSRIDIVNSLAELYEKESCDGIIAFGGGSVLDTGKGVWLNVSMGVKDLNSLIGSGFIPTLSIPLIAIPTTSGTGSEVTKVAVISDPEKGRKMLFNSDNLQPDHAILDSRLTASLPPFLTSITGMDAMTHAVEAFTCIAKNPLSDHLAWTAICLIRDHLTGAVEDPGNLEHRRALAAASNMAGSAFSNSMVGLVHTIGHSVGALCHAPHGSCMSVLLPPVLRYNKDTIEPRLSRLLEAVAGKTVYDQTPAEKRADRTIEELHGMNLKLKELTGGRHPSSLKDIKNREGEPLIREEDFNMIAETALGDGSIIYNPVEARKTDILAILKEAY
ncbi:iron-containing alcohol dehydrogenase [Spirochaeta isovalerica]|uniref:Alcohol dehydrogenase n=1 Tax=Spirochaeta isovalerica TaxID=150 RepID=A0A841R2Q6_9SPIO|nr:iron-containing alcohol dehydrogenase [Spirochaeta isovalerica]MBB6479314.1 alcohol dehydrogenase [Spirochaeta isovalerica]